MAYTPTRQQKSGVRPTGVTQATGMQRLAQAFNLISERTERESRIDRELMFDQAVINAQADGRAAVRFDENKKLVPVTDTFYEPGMFYKTDEAKVKDVFRKTLTQSYVTAFNADVTSAASNALIANPSNPDGIVAVAEEYESNVNALPDELRQAVLPSFISAFERAEITARSAQQKIVNEKLVASGLNRMEQISAEVVDMYYMSGLSANAVDEELVTLRIKELNDIIDNLSNFTDKSRLEEIKDSIFTSIRGSSFKGSIERFYNEKGHDGALGEINKITKDLIAQNEGSLNIDQIVREGKNHLAGLHAKTVAEKQRINDLSNTSGGYLSLLISENEISNLEELTTHEMYNDLLPRRKAELREIVKNRSQANKANDKAELEKINKESMNNLMTELTFETNVAGLPNMGNINRIMSQANQLKQTTSSKGTYSSIAVQHRAMINSSARALMLHLKDKQDIGLSVLRGIMENGEFNYDPSYFRSPEMLNRFFAENGDLKVSFGVTSGDAMNRQKWLNIVNNYTTKWNTHNQDLYYLNKAVNLINVGFLDPKSKEYKAYEKYHLSRSISVTDPQSGNVIPLGIDIFSQNDLQRSASQNYSVKWSVGFKQLHPDLVQAFKNFKTTKNQAGFDEIVALFNTMENVLKRQSNPIEAQLDMADMMSVHGIEYDWLKRASILDYDQFRLVMEGQRSGESEMLKLFAKDGGDFDTSFNLALDEMFKEKSTIDKLKRFIGLNPDKVTDKNHQHMIKQMKDSASNMKTQHGWLSIKPMLEAATIETFDITGHPDIMAILKNGAIGRIATGNYNFTGDNADTVLKTVIGQTLQDLGNSDIGFVVQGDGFLHLEKHPYMKYAKASGEAYGVPVTELHVLADVNRVLKGPINKDGSSMFVNIAQTQMPTLYGKPISASAGQTQGVATQPGDLELPKILKANYPFDTDNPSYTVFGVRPDGSMIPLHPNYSYNFATSMDNVAYKEAMKDFKEGSFGNTAWSMIPFMDGVMLKGMIANYRENQNHPNTIESLTKIVNKARYGAYFLAGEKYQYEPIQIDIVNDYKQYEKFMDSLLSLGIY